jgi:hypothetical protein
VQFLQVFALCPFGESPPYLAAYVEHARHSGSESGRLAQPRGPRGVELASGRIREISLLPRFDRSKADEIVERERISRNYSPNALAAVPVRFSLALRARRGFRESGHARARGREVKALDEDWITGRRRMAWHAGCTRDGIAIAARR